MSKPPPPLSLRDLDRLHIELAWAYEGTVSLAYREELSPHYGQSVLLIEQGGMTVSTPEKTVEAGVGQWVFPRQGKRHQKFSADAKVLSIHFDMHWPGGTPLFAWDTALAVAAAQHPGWEIQARKLVQLIEREFGGARWELRNRPATLLTWRQLQGAFSAWFDLVLVDLLKLGHQPTHFIALDARLLAGVEFLDHQPFTVSYQEREVAAHAGLSVSQWNRLFLKQFSMTPRRYYDKRRLDSALAMVKGGALLKEVAFDLGFCSLPHFSSWFHQKVGCTPTEFRQRGLSQPEDAEI